MHAAAGSEHLLEAFSKEKKFFIWQRFTAYWLDVKSTQKMPSTATAEGRGRGRERQNKGTIWCILDDCSRKNVKIRFTITEEANGPNAPTSCVSAILCSVDLYRYCCAMAIPSENTPQRIHLVHPVSSSLLTYFLLALSAFGKEGSTVAVGYFQEYILGTIRLPSHISHRRANELMCIFL
uniref:Uncharacterized protein n=1 Tax=Glossina austeni TaxID=7395 RepID=A0A1A9VDZ0_GLOAU